MRLLDRYLLRELLVPFFVCLGLMLFMWIAFTLSFELMQFQEKGLVFADIVELFLARLPAVLVLALPVVLLLALLYSLTNHARYHELTAIRAAGISLARICAPYFAVGFVLGGLSFAMNELWAPSSAEREDQINHRHQSNAAANGTKPRGFHFIVNGGAEQWNFDEYDEVRNVMVHPRIKWRGTDGAEYFVAADRGQYLNGVWTFSGVENETKTVGSNQEPVAVPSDTVAVPELRETPDQMRRERKFADKKIRDLTAQPVEFSLMQIIDYLDLHSHDLPPNLRRGWLTQLHGRIAQPWTCLVVVLIAIPFGAASGRRNLFVGVASSILICIVYIVLLKLGLALGTAGWLPPWLGAWFPNLSFGAAAGWMLLRVR